LTYKTFFRSIVILDTKLVKNVLLVIFFAISGCDVYLNNKLHRNIWKYSLKKTSPTFLIVT